MNKEVLVADCGATETGLDVNPQAIANEEQSIKSD
jgi:hypothetical protein